jgi:hypothetical protein
MFRTVFGGEPMNTDYVSPRVQGDVAESVCDARLTLCRLLNEVRAAFGEMDELLGRAERLISSSPREPTQLRSFLAELRSFPACKGHR